MMKCRGVAALLLQRKIQQVRRGHTLCRIKHENGSTHQQIPVVHRPCLSVMAESRWSGLFGELGLPVRCPSIRRAAASILTHIARGDCPQTGAGSPVPVVPRGQQGLRDGEHGHHAVRRVGAASFMIDDEADHGVGGGLESELAPDRLPT